jgi:hypothetical protein
MNKTSITEYRRFYLTESLPEPLTRASEHVQFFDNYITNTRMRLRTIRFPDTKAWRWLMQQRDWAETGTNRICRISDIEMNEAEHAQFETFEGTEIRKNRYVTEIDGRQFEFDVYLGKLWGLNRASVAFASLEELNAFVHPGEAYLDVTDNAFFRDENIVELTFEDIQTEVARLVAA